MTITVIGHFCFDVIHHPDGTETQSYGGIYFTIAALAHLLTPADKIFPVFGLGKADFEEVTTHLETLPGVDTSGIFKFNGETNRVHLYYKDGFERVECSKHIADPIPWKRVKQYLDVNMVLINMVSGNDITLETFDEIRMDIRDQKIPVYFDVHSLTLGVREDATRFRRAVETWRRWLFMLHAVQMNEDEAAGLTPDNLDEDDLAKHVLALNTDAMLITRGGRGATAFIDIHKQIQRAEIEGINVRHVLDPTGCGDVFGAAYCAQYLHSKNIQESARFANRVAAANAELKGSADIGRLSAFRINHQATEVAS